MRRSSTWSTTRRLLKVGEVVHGSIDWERSYKVMKMHTTAHILCAIVNRETGALITGNQINPDESRIDFNLEQFDREKLSDYTRRRTMSWRGGSMSRPTS